MSWSEQGQAYRVIFLVGDAPPHMDYQDDVRYPEIVADARSRLSENQRAFEETLARIRESEGEASEALDRARAAEQRATRRLPPGRSGPCHFLRRRQQKYSEIGPNS